MVKRNGVWKIFTIIGILLLAVLLCYFSVALYFYFGKVNDISGKLKVYNLMSDESVGEMYLDASYCLQSGDKKFYGINVDESGYLVTIASDVADETDFYAYSGRGEVFFGKLVFCDESYNLAIVKLFDIVDSEKELSLPYVSIGDISYSTFSLNPSYIVVGNPLENNNILSVNSLSLYKYIIYEDIYKHNAYCCEKQFTIGLAVFQKRLHYSVKRYFRSDRHEYEHKHVFSLCDRGESEFQDHRA